jgi:hypothetical protein
MDGPGSSDSISEKEKAFSFLPGYVVQAVEDEPKGPLKEY